MDGHEIIAAIKNTEAIQLEDDDKVHRVVNIGKGIMSGLFVKCLNAEVMFVGVDALSSRRLITDINCFDCVPSPLSFWRFVR